MAKTLSPVCKLCRREGEKLYLKGERCFTPKCSFEKRSFAPGQHGRTAGRGRGMGTGRASDFARQLRAKQKARRIYGVLERQFSRIFSEAYRRRGMTGEILLRSLGKRADIVIRDARRGTPTLRVTGPRRVAKSGLDVARPPKR